MTPRVARARPESSMRPLTTSLTVPSPPTATTNDLPARTALRVSSVAEPRAVVSANSKSRPPRARRSLRLVHSRRPLPPPEAGLTTTKARSTLLLDEDALWLGTSSRERGSQPLTQCDDSRGHSRARIPSGHRLGNPQRLGRDLGVAERIECLRHLQHALE